MAVVVFGLKRKVIKMSLGLKIFNRIINKNSVGTSNESTRQKFVKQTLENLPEGLRILDAGAGEQQFKKYCSHLVYVSQDFAQYDGLGDSAGLQMGEWDNSNLDIISDITNIPEPDFSFDVILCTEVFEHLPDPISAIKEFSRLLKPNGTLIITAPFCSLTHFAPYHFYTGFNRYFYETHLKSNNFNMLSIEHNGNYFEYIGQEIRRIETVANKYANSSLNFIEYIALVIALKMLNKMSKVDNGSQELLHFDFQVIAKKQ